MTKQFKHPKLNIYATDGYTNEKGISTYYVKFDGRTGERYEENLLIALGFEEVKDTYFGNGMVDGGSGHWLNTTYNFKSHERYQDLNNGEKLKSDWSNFQTKEQAEQFDKMMMTVWKIWKWKKENDDCEIQDECIELSYSLPRSAFEQVFVGCNGYSYGFFLPKFSSDKKVIQLISDLGKELNNLLCWNYPGKK